MLGLRYTQGTGVAQDKAKAAKLLKRACDGGIPTACKALRAQ